MLVLTRKAQAGHDTLILTTEHTVGGERVVIAEITVLPNTRRGTGVRIGITAPSTVKVLRRELELDPIRGD